MKLPTPLTIVPARRPSGIQYHLEGPQGRRIATVLSSGEADEIALRVNVHDQMVAALRRLINHGIADRSVMDAARAALVAAGETP